MEYNLLLHVLLLWERVGKCLLIYVYCYSPCEIMVTYILCIRREKMQMKMALSFVICSPCQIEGLNLSKRHLGKKRMSKP